MATVERVIKDYKTTLDELQRNDKLKINVLTILAEDYAKYSQHIVKLIEDSIFEAETIPLKLVRLYLVDSIVKNVKSAGSYADYFSDNLVKVFLHVFQRSNEEKVRESLFKLRNTWKDVFPRGKLYLLDIEVNKIDSKWIPAPLLNKNVPSVPPQKTVTAPIPKKAPAVVKSEAPSNNATSTSNASTNKAGNGMTNGQKNRIYINPKFVNEPPAKKSRPNSPPKETPTIKVEEKPVVKVEEMPVVKTTEKRPVENKKKDLKYSRPNRRPTPLVGSQNSPKSTTVSMLEPTVAPGMHAFNLPPPVSMVQQPMVTTTTQPPPAFVPISTSNMPIQAVTTQAPVFSTAPTNIHFLPPPQIRNEAPRLPNLPSNNRIFVDGKAYEVFYLDNVAVIERNGVPHRISFNGSPRDVIIDNVAYQLPFGETMPVVIDGQTHFLRFGAPSRELYMGDFAFKGVFGGPPIACVINGRRHEIRLGGPAPEVKIEQDPCYELIRHMQNLRQNNTSDLPQPKRDGKDMKIGDLLAKLQKTGVLDTLSSVVNAKSAPSTSSSIPPFNAHREATPPIIPSNVKLDKFEVRQEPTTPLSRFYMPDLKVRYLSIINGINKRRSTCPECGIFFEDAESPEYRTHLDEHIQIDISSVALIHPMGSSRQRYFSEEEWIGYSRIEERNRIQPSASVDEAENSDESDEDE